jgi:DNA helicase HerA-like ATPase
VGLILEQLLPLGGTIIVFDPNSDYVMMRRRPNGQPTPFAENIVVYRPRSVRGRRFNDDEIGGAESYTIDFSRLEPEEIFEITGISESWVKISGAVRDALGALNGIYGPEQLVQQLELQANAPGRDRVNSANALPHIRRLLSYAIWGQKTIPLDDLTKPKRMSIIDLAGLQKRVSEYIVNKTLREVWSKAVTGELEFPIFLVLEEAHSYAPAQGTGDASSSGIIERIAAEGRKFGMFLTVVTQRPNKINSNVLSQCNSQIVMRLTNPDDMNAVRNSSEGLSENLFNDLPSFNRGEAVVVGEFTKVPTMFKVPSRDSERGRKSGEGGTDIDVPTALKAALGKYNFNTVVNSQASEQKDAEPLSQW